MTINLTTDQHIRLDLIAKEDPDAKVVGASARTADLCDVEVERSTGCRQFVLPTGRLRRSYERIG